MPFHHEKLKVYQRALEFAGWSRVLIDSLTKRTSTRDHLERAGDSVALNIAEGNGKFSQRDRAKFFQIAHGSALECAACLDLLVARLCCSPEAIVHDKEILEQIAKMLFKMLGQLGCRIAEDPPEYSSSSSASTSSLATTFVRFSNGEKPKRRRLSGRGS